MNPLSELMSGMINLFNGKYIEGNDDYNSSNNSDLEVVGWNEDLRNKSVLRRLIRKTKLNLDLWEEICAIWLNVSLWVKNLWNLMISNWVDDSKLIWVIGDLKGRLLKLKLEKENSVENFCAFLIEVRWEVGWKGRVSEVCFTVKGVLLYCLLCEGEV